MSDGEYAPLDLEKLQANVPAQLRELPVWLLWRARPKKDGGKPDKVPYYVTGKMRATGIKLDSQRDREQLVPFVRALDAFDRDKDAGIGAALGPVGDSLILSGIDLDNTVNDEGVISPKALQVVQAGAGAYTEISPSQHGLKIFGTGDIGTVKESTKGLEIYSRERYFTVTGEHIEGDRLAPLDAAAHLARGLLLAADALLVSSGDPGRSIDMTNRSRGNRNHAAYGFACLIRQKKIEGDPAWQMMLAFNQSLVPPLDERELRTVYKSSLKRALGDNDFGDLNGCHPSIVEELRSLSPKVLVLPNDYVTPNVSGRIIFEALGAQRLLFTRGGKVVEVADIKADAEAIAAPGVSIVSPDELRSRLSRCGYILKQAVRKPKSDELVLTYRHCSRDVASVLLGTLEAQEHLPPIQLVTQAPVLIIDGAGKPRVLGPGYHEQGGGIFVCGRRNPKQVALGEAVHNLQELLADFMFASQADKSRAIAGFIGPALRMGSLVEGGRALVSVVEADQSQTGKGYLCEAEAAVYGEQAYPIAQREGGVGSLDESFGAALASARSFVLFDNLRDLLASKYIEFALTAPHGLVTVRVPHKGEITVDISRVSFQLTSNGVRATVDFGNRALLTRLRKRDSNLQFKRFAEGDLLSHIQANQPYFLGCVFAVVKEWIRAGCPRNQVAHSFHQWAGTLDWIVQEVFKLPPLLEGHTGAIERVSNPALSWLREIAIAVVAQGKTRLKLQASALVEIAAAANIIIPDLRGAEDGDGPRNQAVGRLLARCFAKSSEVQLDNVTVTRTESVEYSPSQRRDLPVKRYIFRHESEAQMPLRQGSERVSGGDIDA